MIRTTINMTAGVSASERIGGKDISPYLERGGLRGLEPVGDVEVAMDGGAASSALSAEQMPGDCVLQPFVPHKKTFWYTALPGYDW